MLKKIKDTMQKCNLIDKGERIVVGVSGGPDSVALLYALKSLSEELKINLYVAHLDHMLRKDSPKDREFVAELAQKLKLPFFTEQINLKELSRRGSLEEIARNARLEFLFKIAKQVKARKVALGHNLDDQAETVLMRILRGTGLYGLSGMLPKRKICGYEIIRPLIKVRRREIDAFLKKRRIKPRIDTSNLEDIYLRNKIRNRLMPLLEKEYNRNMKEILGNMAESIGYDYDYLVRQAEKAMQNIGPRIKIVKFLKLHPALQRLVLRLSFAKVKGDMRRIAFKHIKEMEDLILNRPVNSIVNLPKGISVIKKKTYLFFSQKRFN